MLRLSVGSSFLQRQKGLRHGVFCFFVFVQNTYSCLPAPLGPPYPAPTGIRAAFPASVLREMVLPSWCTRIWCQTLRPSLQWRSSRKSRQSPAWDRCACMPVCMHACIRMMHITDKSGGVCLGHTCAQQVGLPAFFYFETRCLSTDPLPTY